MKPHIHTLLWLLIGLSPISAHPQVSIDGESWRIEPPPPDHGPVSQAIRLDISERMVSFGDDVTLTWEGEFPLGVESFEIWVVHSQMLGRVIGVGGKSSRIDRSVKTVEAGHYKAGEEPVLTSRETSGSFVVEDIRFDTTFRILYENDGEPFRRTGEYYDYVDHKVFGNDFVIHGGEQVSVQVDRETYPESGPIAVVDNRVWVWKSPFIRHENLHAWFRGRLPYRPNGYDEYRRKERDHLEMGRHIDASQVDWTATYDPTMERYNYFPGYGGRKQSKRIRPYRVAQEEGWSGSVDDSYMPLAIQYGYRLMSTSIISHEVMHFFTTLIPGIWDTQPFTPGHWGWADVDGMLYGRKQGSYQFVEEGIWSLQYGSTWLYAPLELYAMGYIGWDQVPTIKQLFNKGGRPELITEGRYGEINQEYTGTYYYTADELRTIPRETVDAALAGGCWFGTKRYGHTFVLPEDAPEGAKCNKGGSYRAPRSPTHPW